MKNNTILTLILTVLIAIGVYTYMNNRKESPLITEQVVVATTTHELPSGKISLQLETTGLGSVTFGATEDDVLTVFNRALGTSTKDTGWISSLSTYGTCPGELMRVVEWNRLRVFFGNTKYGTKKFFQYEYTDRDTKTAKPLITTPEGLTLNSTKAELLKLYPKATITPWTENYEQFEKFVVNESLRGTLKDGKVFWISGGVECSGI